MQNSKLAAFVSVAVALGGLVEAATINTPQPIVQCQPIAISWSDGQGDVYITAVEGTNVAAPPVVTLPTQQGASGSVTWKANVASGTTLTFIINDSTGQPNFSGQTTVGQSQDSSCVGQDSATTASSAGGATTIPVANPTGSGGSSGVSGTSLDETDEPSSDVSDSGTSNSTNAITPASGSNATLPNAPESPRAPEKTAAVGTSGNNTHPATPRNSTTSVPPKNSNGAAMAGIPHMAVPASVAVMAAMLGLGLFVL